MSVSKHWFLLLFIIFMCVLFVIQQSRVGTVQLVSISHINYCNQEKSLCTVSVLTKELIINNVTYHQSKYLNEPKIGQTCLLQQNNHLWEKLTNQKYYCEYQ